MKSSLSIHEARALALSAQGFGQDRNKKPTWTKMQREIERLHLLQIDSVNVLVRSHYMPLFSRLGTYARETLDKRSLEKTNRAVFECWAHEASLVNVDLHPLMRWRMAQAREGKGIYRAMAEFGRNEKAFLKKTLAHIEKFGSTAQSDLPGEHKGAGGWWGWSKGKLALETLFAQGLVTTSHRDKFECIYDLPERVIPSEVLALPSPNARDTIKTLTALSAEALGVATALDLRDYFRLPIAEAKKGLADCLEDGAIEPVQVEGWKQEAYVPKGAKLTRENLATCLVTPFDPIVWNRERAERLFNFHYRIELYTPESKRKFGYYVLPFLHNGKFAGRVCLKADRANATLNVNASHMEDDADPRKTAAALKVELHRMQEWLGLSQTKITPRGNLAKYLNV